MSPKNLITPQEIQARYGWSRAEIARLAHEYGWSTARDHHTGWRVRYGERLVDNTAIAEDRARLDGAVALDE